MALAGNVEEVAGKLVEVVAGNVGEVAGKLAKVVAGNVEEVDGKLAEVVAETLVSLFLSLQPCCNAGTYSGV
jgi:uncharacterized protein YjbJ (UPF0337 family)